MTDLEINLINREQMLSRLRAEIVGPDPCGTPVLLIDKQEVTWAEFNLARKQLNGEEILWQDPPTKRYGAGVLFPIETTEETELTAAISEAESDGSPTADIEIDSPHVVSETSINLDRSDFSIEGLTGDDDEVSLTNSFRPSALGISLLADLTTEAVGINIELVCIGRVGSKKLVEHPCGTYKPIGMRVSNNNSKNSSSRKVWPREPIVNSDGTNPSVLVSSLDLLKSRRVERRTIGPAHLQLEIVIVSRHWRGAPSANHRLLTITLINKKIAVAAQLDLQCVFQAGIRVSGQSDGPWIDAYPENLVSDFHDSNPLADENVNGLLYRENRTFGVGHGCSVDWIDGRPQRIKQIWSDVLPVFEAPATSADLFVNQPDGRRVPLRVSMRLLAGLDPNDDGFADIERLIEEHTKWIQSLEIKAKLIEIKHQNTITALIHNSKECAARIADGLALLRETGPIQDKVRKAFRLTNKAMLVAQRRARLSVRSPVQHDTARTEWIPTIQQIDESEFHPTEGYWRPFQIAFLLMSLRSIYDPDHRDREVVDLIWFPTGGGKTEAYLGLTAFTIFFNAISNKSGGGVDVLMRYTLRLLTTQQFQRASTLFCAMERIRYSEQNELGSRPFRIGLWVGGETTPNNRLKALERLKDLLKNPEAVNPYILLQCPWCAAKFGPVISNGFTAGRGHGNAKTKPPSRIYGYKKEKSQNGDDTVVYRCSDEDCAFGGIPGSKTSPLPIVVIDEDLFDAPPNLLIGTVDKFAMLAWKPEARSIFGLDAAGAHIGTPPTLVIQDELHLISGPLGSMVGAYEMVIESLCVDQFGGMVKPKIVASTATISRAREQVRSLYARKNVMLFPPSGIDASDSFFAREALDLNNNLKPGRLYVGILASAHGSLQTTQARVFATLAQNATLLAGTAKSIDPWWTLLVFFNSLRELGSAATLFSADTKEYLKVIINRLGIDSSKTRILDHVEEFTSRRKSDDIPKLLERLAKSLIEHNGATAQKDSVSPLDACLASSIIEVGIDIPRLSLMSIIGQPKTTSQYIQVSSRVGRDEEKPGMVVVLYGQTKARDRSHYERFRPFHQCLYAQVEPTSVTPFSPPAVDRALHGLVVALVRQLGDPRSASSPDPFPVALDGAIYTRIHAVLLDRIKVIAPEQESQIMVKLLQRLKQWEAWNPKEYGGFGKAPVDAPLMHPAGSAARADWNARSWPTLSSLRDVDASCEATVTTTYRDMDQEN